MASAQVRGRRTATDPSEVQPGPRKSDDSKSWAVLHRTSAPYVLRTSGQLRGRCASRCSSHLGWEHFCQCGGPMYDREVRSENSRRKVRNKGGTTTRRPSLALLDPLLMNFRARVFHHHSPFRAAVRTCRAASSLRNKRPGLLGRPHCKGVAIGVARRGARRSGERTLRVPPSCSDPVSHSCGPHVASFVRRSSVLAQLNCGCGLLRVRGAGACDARASRKKERPENGRPKRATASCACGVLAAGARARRGAGGELQRLARRERGNNSASERRI